MIDVNVVGQAGFSGKKHYELRANSEDQAFLSSIFEGTTHDSSEDRKTLDDFLRKVDTQKIVVDNGGICAYIKTAPVGEGHGFLKRAGNLIPSFGTTTKKKFGVQFDGYDTNVLETKTKDGTIYEIFINLDRSSRKSISEAAWDNEIEDASDSFEPVKSGGKKEDKARERMRVADFMRSLSQFYEKIGISSNGSLVFNTSYSKRERFGAFASPDYAEFGLDKLAGLNDIIDDMFLLDDHTMVKPSEAGELRELYRYGNCAFWGATHWEVKKRMDDMKKEIGMKPEVKKTGKDAGNLTSVIRMGGDRPAEEPEDKLSFKDIIGANEAKEELKGVIKYLKNPVKYKKERGYGMRPGCVLYGPPGTGKTLLAKAFAQEAGVEFVHYKASDVLDKWVGSSEQNLQRMLDEATAKGKCVIFIDEFEQLAVKRGEGHRVEEKLVDMLLTYLDGFEKKGDVYLIGATNQPEKIDDALRSSKGGRMLEIEVGLPDYTARKKMIEKVVEEHRKKVKVSPFSTKLDYNKISNEAEGLSGRALVSMQQSAFRRLCDRYYDAKEEGRKPKKLTTNDWIKEINSSKSYD